MKIAVYAIALNEAKHVKRWLASCQDADHTILTDTGSTDTTYSEWHAGMYDISVVNQFEFIDVRITPFRFDHARNTALALVPGDVDLCIALDLDETLEPGWRKTIEDAWTPDTTRMTYRFDLGDGRHTVGHRIHARHAYDWKYPIHEALVAKREVKEHVKHIDDTLMIHRSDVAKSRGQYLKMLFDATQEYPEDSRMRFYHGRELMYRGWWQEAIDELEFYLKLDREWSHQRAEAMRYIARCYEGLKNTGRAGHWYQTACLEAPGERQNWLMFADHRRRMEDWAGGYWAVTQALACPARPQQGTYEPHFLDVGPYDIGSLCAFYLGLKDRAREWFEKAIELDPSNERLRKNLSFVTAA